MRSVIVMVLLVLGLAVPAEAVVYKSGANIELLTGNCSPFTGVAYYSQQNAPGSTVGIEPKVGEIFYVGITTNFFQSFSCAADFWASVITLPAGVVPAVGEPDSTGGTLTKPICLRRAFGANNQVYNDARMTSNCPTTVRSDNTALSFDPSTRELRIGPKADAAFPDQGNPASRFFIGQNAPAENTNYTQSVVLVPVKATQTVNAPMTTLLCTTGTSCQTGSTVQMVVNAANPPAAVDVALGGGARTSAVGVSMPFAVTYAGGTQITIRIDIASGGVRPCGVTSAQFVDITEGGTFDFLVGDFDTFPPIDCRLTPNTDYDFEVCHTDYNGTTEYLCRVTAFRTGAVNTAVEPPEETATDRPDSRTMVFRGRKVVGPHPAGQAFLRRKLAGAADGTFDNSPTNSAAQSDTDAALPDRTLAGFTEWSTYEVQSCFNAASLMCSPSSTLVAGYITAPADATNVSPSGATVTGLPSSPRPAGKLAIRTSTSDPGTKDPRTALSEKASTQLAARSETTAATPTAIQLSGLAAGTKYYWAACFDVAAAAAIEDCSAVRSFTTAAGGEDPGLPLPPPPSPSPVGPVATAAPTATAAPAPGPTAVADTTKPKVSLKAKGALRRGKKISLTVTATDAGGIKSVTIKLGAKKPVAKRKLTITLPRRKGRLKIVVTVVDNAGNRVVLTRTLTVR